MKPSGQRTAVLLDQYPLWLEAVEPVVAKLGMRVLGKATTPERALELIREGQPDVLVSETHMPENSMSGTQFLREAHEAAPSAKMIVLGSSRDPEEIDAALEAGAHAYVVKTAHPDDIASTIRQAFEHSVFFANGRRTTEVSGERASAHNGHSVSPGLTRRELEILQLVAEGHSNGQLARMLWVTEQTVKFHLSNIYRKLDVSNRTEASRWAQRHGLLSEPAPQVA
jgi:DNA-binding NarL/FixJ family response regulator